ncbi:cyclin-domain-containing protein [Myxozyma melibiosi]|uniref:Cyclin-domain-containing protein n=1 Tax=Myxozyma melibiosi TaxID=54550 RepID=A0ABR1FFN4_9ASCO
MSATVLLERHQSFSTPRSQHLIRPIDTPPSPPPSMADLSPSDALHLLIVGIRRILAVSDPAAASWQRHRPSAAGLPVSPPPSAPLSPPMSAFDIRKRDEQMTPSPTMMGALASSDSDNNQLSPATEQPPCMTDDCPPQQQQQQEQPSAEDLEAEHQRYIVDKANQRAIVSRRFWSKAVPEIDIEKYLRRIHQYCPTSTAVYLATSLYIYRLCVVSQAVPLTPLNAHRLVIAALRIASKNLEDINHSQKRFAKVGGLSESELCRLEIGMLFLIDFDLKVDVQVLEEQAGLLMELEKC